MNHKSYAAEVDVNAGFDRFDFTSVGPRGRIKKRIAIMPTDNPEIFNLAFGDLKSNGIEIDDKAVTDNGDRNKILATIAAVMDLYTDRYPDRCIYFQGNTPERTRLYRMAISQNLIELSTRYDIYGLLEDDNVLPFSATVNFQAFVVRRKI